MAKKSPPTYRTRKKITQPLRQKKSPNLSDQKKNHATSKAKKIMQKKESTNLFDPKKLEIGQILGTFTV